jgi:hypothetical protein
VVWKSVSESVLRDIRIVNGTITASVLVSVMGQTIIDNLLIASG